MVTLELVQGFGNQAGGVTRPALLQVLVDGQPVDAAPWFDGAMGEVRHQSQAVLRQHFSLTEAGLIAASRDFSHFSEREMSEVLSHLLASLLAASENETRVRTANDRLSRSLSAALRD